ncbi:unnamed protein product [Musa textilis]
MHGHLILLVLHEIGNCLLLLAERTGYQVNNFQQLSPFKRYLTCHATAAQIKNFALVSICRRSILAFWTLPLHFQV